MIQPRERAAFLRRTSDAFQAHRRQAAQAGRFIHYDLLELQRLVERGLGERACPYCRGPVTPANFAVGHRQPIARGGTFSHRNLAVCCDDCHGAKGALDDQEFRELLEVLRGWAKPVRNHLLARLSAAAGPRLPEAGSLGWFTGSDEGHEPPRTRDHDHTSPFRTEGASDEGRHHPPTIGKPAGPGDLAL